MIKDFEKRRIALKAQSASYRERMEQVTYAGIPHLSQDVGSDDNLLQLGECRSPVFEDSVDMLVAGIMGSFPSPSRKWFDFGVWGDTVELSSGSAQYFSDLSEMIRDIVSSGNFYRTLPMFLRDAIAVDCGAILALPDFDEITRFHHIPAGSFYVGRDHKGDVIRFYRELSMSAVEMVSDFGKDNVSGNVKKDYIDGGSSKAYNVVHVIEKNDGVLQSKDAGWKGKNFRSIYYQAGTTDESKAVMRTSGYDSIRVSVFQWRLTKDGYGRGIGSKALPLLKDLNNTIEQKATLITQIVEPSLYAESSAFSNDEMAASLYQPKNISLLSSTDSNMGVKPVLQQSPVSIQILDSLIGKLEGQLRQACHVDAFLMLSSMDAQTQRTATEIQELRTEKQLSIGSPLNGIDIELNNLLGFVLEDAYNAELIPPPPEDASIEKMDLKYTSVLHQAVQEESIGRELRFAEAVAQYGSINPEALAIFNARESLRTIGKQLGVDPDSLVDSKTLAAQDEQKAAAEQQAQMMESAQASAGMAKDMSQADISGDNVLSAAMEGLGG